MALTRYKDESGQASTQVPSPWVPWVGEGTMRTSIVVTGVTSRAATQKPVGSWCHLSGCQGNEQLEGCLCGLAGSLELLPPFPAHPPPTCYPLSLLRTLSHPGRTVGTRLMSSLVTLGAPLPLYHLTFPSIGSSLGLFPFLRPCPSSLTPTSLRCPCFPSLAW